jgi:hypothetical protein
MLFTKPESPRESESIQSLKVKVPAELLNHYVGEVGGEGAARTRRVSLLRRKPVLYV